MRRPKAFTLIELLVVIAIISILAGLLVPGLGAAWGRAYQVDCLSNIKNIALASQFYANAFDDFPPVVDYRADPELAGYTMHFFGSYSLADQDVRYDRGPLAPYLGGFGAIFKCRAAAKIQMLSQCLAANETACDYGYNTDLAARWVEDPPGSWNYVLKNFSLSQITRPGETIAFCDSAANYTYGVWPNPNEYGNLRENWTIDWYPQADWGVNQPRRDGTCHFRHDGKANAAFFDGSVRSISAPDPAFLEENQNVDFPFLQTSPYYDGE